MATKNLYKNIYQVGVTRKTLGGKVKKYPDYNRRRRSWKKIEQQRRSCKKINYRKNASKDVPKPTTVVIIGYKKEWVEDHREVYGDRVYLCDLPIEAEIHL